MTTSFTKMHGLGNDFVVIDNLDGLQVLDNDRIRGMADRHFGIGFDQLLVIEASTVADAEFDYRIFNADGGEVEHCGNGARCFARYVRDRGLTDSHDIRVNTDAGILTLRIRDDDQVTVEMGVPEFAPELIPFKAEQADFYTLVADESEFQVGAVAIGNPHVVMRVDDIDTAPVNTLGPTIECHARFPNRVNVGFMQIINRKHIRLRVYERGVGETRACGTGACAAAVIGHQQNLLDKSVIVTLPGGDLSIHWPERNSNVEMTGPCTTVFEGHTKM